MRWVKLEECCINVREAQPRNGMLTLSGEKDLIGSHQGFVFDWNTKEIGRAPEQVTDEGLNSCSAK